MKPLEIYVHIPFCVKKCNYCDFLSAPAGRQEQRRYIESLCRQIRSVGETAKAYRVISIFVGGGTPSILEEEQTARIFQSLRDTFYIEGNAEITIEMNPGTVTKDKLKVYRAAGINRLSIGLQSADDTELKVLGRVHDFHDFIETYGMAREEGFGNINVDLMSAVPGQTIKSFTHTLQTVSELGPEHISVYSLIIEEGTPFYDIYGNKISKDSEVCQEYPKLPDEDAERQMYYDTKRILEGYGYHRYEISNYAKEGYECIHNLGYWDRTEYLGFGDGAASFLNHKRWVSGKQPEVLSVKDEMEEYMFLGLRKMEGVSKMRFHKEFNCKMEHVYKKVLADMESKQLLEQQGDFVRLTEKGIDVSNYVMSGFLL